LKEVESAHDELRRSEGVMKEAQSNVEQEKHKLDDVRKTEAAQREKVARAHGDLEKKKIESSRSIAMLGNENTKLKKSIVDSEVDMQKMDFENKKIEAEIERMKTEQERLKQQLDKVKRNASSMRVKHDTMLAQLETEKMRLETAKIKVETAELLGSNNNMGGGASRSPASVTANH
jgi:multidrug resistance efflux pump